MAKASSGLISGVINTIRGQFASRETKEPAIVKQQRVLVTETVADAVRKGTRIAQGTAGATRNQNLLASSTFGTQMFMTTAQKKQENRDIMEMFPDLERNARYLIASYFSPVDLNITRIPISANCAGLTSNRQNSAQEKLTAYFEDVMELSTELPDIAYNMGFISGGELIITIPKLSLTAAFDSVISSESLKEKIESLSPGSFTNATNGSSGMSAESLSATDPELNRSYSSLTTVASSSKSKIDEFLQEAISTENLKLTSNMQVLGMKKAVDDSNAAIHTREAAGLPPQKPMQVKAPVQPTGVLPAPAVIDGIPALGRPVTIRVGAESAFFVFPPGSPDKPIAAILMLDEHGAPLSMGSYGSMGMANASIVSGATTNSLFQDVGRATTNTANVEYMRMEGQRQLQELYRSFMSTYITKKVADAGYGKIDIGDTESVMRSLFYRYLERRATRMLIVPKEYFTYFTFGVGPDGIGRTKIEGIKQYLVMKMTVLVSRVLASTRAAADTREITVTMDTASMLPEDVIIEAVKNGYVQKNLLDLSSLNMNSIQSRVLTSALQISVKNASGAQDGAMNVDNQPITQGKPVDFDPEITTYIDSQINAKVPVPASLTSSLDEPELATTITTANLFYSMLVSMDQRRIARHATTWVRQHARHSQEVREIIAKVLETNKDKAERPTGDAGSMGDTVGTETNGITVDDVINSLTVVLPKPIIAKSNAQFANITNMTDAVSKIVDLMYPDAMITDDTDKGTLGVVKAAATRDIVAGLAAESGLTQISFNTASVSKSLQDTLELRDIVSNTSKGLADQDALSKPPAASTDTSGAEDTSGGAYGDTGGDGTDPGAGGYL